MESEIKVLKDRIERIKKERIEVATKLEMLNKELETIKKELETKGIDGKKLPELIKDKENEIANTKNFITAQLDKA